MGIRVSQDAEKVIRPEQEAQANRGKNRGQTSLVVRPPRGGLTPTI